MTPLRKAAITAVILIGLDYLLNVAPDTPSSPSASAVKTGSAADACYMAQKFVTSRLKALATADFQPCHEVKVNPQSEGNPGDCYAMFSYVDSQNAFGAKLRKDYFAVVQYDGYDQGKREYSWNLVTLTLEEGTWASPDMKVPCPK
jgi:hypothetical protein